MERTKLSNVIHTQIERNITLTREKCMWFCDIYIYIFDFTVHIEYETTSQRDDDEFWSIKHSYTSYI